MTTPSSPVPLGSTIAIFDIGTNATRFGVYTRTENGWDRRHKDHEFCELGRLSQNGNLSPEGIDKTTKALRRFCQISRNPDYNVCGVVAVATEALRRAVDGSNFIQKIKQDLDLSIELIDGTTEARLGALGVASMVPGATGLVVDLGGGSLQLTRIENGVVQRGLSLPLGVQRLTNAGEGCAEFITTTLENTPDIDPSPATNLYVIGGSLRSFGRLYQLRSGAPHSALVDDIVMDPEMIKRMTQWMNESPEAAIHEISDPNTHNIHFDRAKFLPVAGLALSALIDTFHPQEIHVSSAGIRDGLLQEIKTGARKLSPVPTVPKFTPSPATTPPQPTT